MGSLGGGVQRSADRERIPPPPMHKQRLFRKVPVEKKGRRNLEATRWMPLIIGDKQEGGKTPRPGNFGACSERFCVGRLSRCVGCTSPSRLTIATLRHEFTLCYEPAGISAGCWESLFERNECFAVWGRGGGDLESSKCRTRYRYGHPSSACRMKPSQSEDYFRFRALILTGREVNYARLLLGTNPWW